MTGVKKSTAYSIFQHAVKNATQKRIEATSIGSAQGLTGQGGERLRNAEERASDARRWEKEWEEEKRKGKEGGPSAQGGERLGNAEERASDDDFLAHSVQRLSLREPETPVECKPVGVLVSGPELSLQELISQDALDPKKRTGRPQSLTEAEKDRLVATVKRDFKTRRMRLVDLRREAGLSHVSDTTVFRALQERGLKAYREEFKFILSEENKKIRLVYCQARQHWEADKEHLWHSTFRSLWIMAFAKSHDPK
jgi:hypothetical protein